MLNKPIQLQYASDWPLAADTGGHRRPDRPDRRQFIRRWCFPASDRQATLQNQPGGQPGSGLMRTSLVVMQFAVSIGLGIAAHGGVRANLICPQCDLGFRKDGIVVIDADRWARPPGKAYRDALRSRSGTEMARISGIVPFDGPGTGAAPSRCPGTPGTSLMRSVSDGSEFPQLYHIPLLAAGRFRTAWPGPDGTRHDAANVLINQRRAKIGLVRPQSALGKSYIQGQPRGKATIRLTIVGVAPISDCRDERAGAP